MTVQRKSKAMAVLPQIQLEEKKSYNSKSFSGKRKKQSALYNYV